MNSWSTTSIIAGRPEGPRNFEGPDMSTKTIAALLLASTGGCATVYEGKYEFSQGWREAQVVEIAPASQIEWPEFFECIREGSPQERATESFIVLSYRRMGKTAKRAAPLSANPQLRVGDMVYVNASRCDSPVVKRQE